MATRENELDRAVDVAHRLVWTALADGQIDVLNLRWSGSGFHV
ncbi:MAG TPA: hypothetical protein VK722_08225 [Candidatus Aquilonibacter sp.]|jgi:hypothetical protein|nr:hypothetical protein [Candidatus Aquilonibacter sp.]